ncbi:helix-turn-helix domain-containing protein [Streptomyces sp. NPDC020794]|uniref:helix-turn-helix domain-containing protein n=1 Tax=unclassified Streptomyces TaxID=2593676 RepID=UPI0036EA488D
MAEFPSTGKLPHHLRREGTRMYRLNVARLREVAKQHGDRSAYAIAKRTGVNVSSAYRIHSGETQPDLINALRIADAYDVDIRTLMDRVEDEADEDEPAGVAA